MLEGFLYGLDGKESACNAGDPGSVPGLTGDPGSVSGSRRSPGEGNDIHSSILAWRTPWREEPGRLQPMELQVVRHD